MCEHKEDMIRDLESKLVQLKAQCAESIKPVEQVIVEHPLPSVLVAAGAGILIGFLFCKFTGRGE